MVSFSCESCNDVLTKKKLDQHRNQCRGCTFTCLDCSVHFQGVDYRAHTSCISEAQKYQGALYKEKKKGPKQKQNGATPVNNQQLVRKAYVEEEADIRVAIVDAPPRAPSPPPPSGFNVFDFLEEASAVGPPEAPVPENNSRLIDDREYESSSGSDSGSDLSEDDDSEDMDTDPTDPAQDAFDEARQYMKHELLKQGYGYERYDPHTQLPMSPAEHSFVTPAPRHSRNISSVSADSVTKESNRKRKRGHPEELDLSSAQFLNADVDMTDIAPVAHSGLTGGLNRLLPRTDFPPSPPDMDGIDTSPPNSPIKRTKHSREDKERGRTKEKEKEKKKKSSGKDKTKKKEEKAAKEKKKASRLQGELVKSGGQWVRRRPRKDSSNAEAPTEKPTENTAKRQQKQLEYKATEASGDETNDQALILHPDKMYSHAQTFMSLVTKGPESEKGCSINKALKRYHRERGTKNADAEKDLWKILRMKRNDRGEVVLFVEGMDL
ncbi:Zinc finger C2H2 LYAR-type protein [Venturia nashicola]|uniref:Zinc finger C2H2 LYAR-type protein n=1 Tax=Venturia nashicola TaxID=86259 RepID=A0A4Z1PVL6_9PEZI|nr:Zinc finger C2H2 LYAR-type protein [Venturia nashicola]TLD39230.1 Zinc finger C2H2 LYAR-type protein [Venturia nashicola]